MIYIPLFLSCAVLLRNDGIVWILLLLFIIFAGDTGAYYVGTYFGARKLCPGVSPGKTVEGALGGLAATLLVGSVIKMLFIQSIDWPESLFFLS